MTAASTVLAVTLVVFFAGLGTAKILAVAAYLAALWGATR